VTDHPTDRFTEVHDLVTAQLEGELTDEQATRLEQLVCDDAEARRLYVQHVEQSVSLRWWAGQPGGEVAPAQPPVAKLAPGASADSQEPQVVARVGRRTWLTPLRVAAVVALLVGIGYLLTTSTSIPMDPSPEFAETPTDNAPHAPAMLADASDATWHASMAPELMHVGAKLPAGPLRLESGSAQVLLNSGAAVTLIGPTEFEITGNNTAFLTRGRVLARVPERASNFTLHTPTTTVVDLGTEFGVHVTESDVEVHVFRGSVRTTRLDADRQPRQTFEMTADEAMRISRSEPPVEIAAAPSEFHITPPVVRPPLIDNFAGNRIDTDKWQVNLPFDTSSVTQRDGHLELKNRGQLITTNWYDAADGGLRITFQWTPRQSKLRDSLLVITRLHELTLGERWGHLTDGLHFRYEPDRVPRKSVDVSVPNAWEGGENRHNEQKAGELTFRPGATYDVVVIDDGRGFSITMTEVGDPTNTSTASGSIPADMNPPTSGYIAVHNRERFEGADYVSTITNFRVESIDPPAR